jgi:hypothetical protein
LIFGELVPGSWVGVDRLGWRHLAMEPIYLVSPDIAKELISTIDYQGAISPVIDRSSDLAKRVSEILSRLPAAQLPE